ncbi:uncharacterized protein CELE_Y97E10C.2 [Caenorhabditis elegans]|uniref:Secreted protein n=1 Tax=Caenorhabditis elegans TaxID=6239 RepID=A0A8S4QB26_CAEEL|nr:Secreted protein [Caenorhabditis elegans]CAH2189257.1 Secreted protein [Caenorhabditis elegans]
MYSLSALLSIIQISILVHVFCTCDFSSQTEHVRLIVTLLHRRSLFGKRQLSSLANCSGMLRFLLIVYLLVECLSRKVSESLVITVL